MICGDCHKKIDPDTGECECLPPITQADLGRFYSRSTPCPGCSADWVKLPNNILEVTHLNCAGFRIWGTTVPDRIAQLPNLYGYVSGHEYPKLDDLPNEAAQLLNQLLGQIEELTYRVLFEARKVDLDQSIYDAIFTIAEEQAEQLDSDS